MGRKGGAAAGLSSTGEEAETRETTPAAQDTGPEPNKEKIKEILASNLDPAEKLRLIVEEQRLVDKENVREAVAMLTPEEREELDRRAVLVRLLFLVALVAKAWKPKSTLLKVRDKKYSSSLRLALSQDHSPITQLPQDVQSDLSPIWKFTQPP
jgi:hypothetical protein